MAPPLNGSYGVIRLDPTNKAAVKFTRLIDPVHEDAKDANVLACNVREVAFARWLIDHPLEGVVRYSAAHVSDDGAIISRMEIGDGTLHDYVAKTSFAERLDRFDDVLQQLAIALCNMHRHGVIHGDLKPNNILRVGGRFKLIDFGGLTWYKRCKRHESLCTYVTRAPELFSDPIGVESTPVCDAWSLGATMYFFVTRRFVVDDGGGGEGDTMAYVRQQFDDNKVSVKFPTAVPRHVVNIIENLLQIDPERRWSCERVLHEYFGMFLTDRLADPSNAWQRVGHDKRIVGDSEYIRVFHQVRRMVAERGEWGCLPLAMEYVKCAVTHDFTNLSETRVRDVTCAAYVLARAIIYDRDTDATLITEAIRKQMVGIMRTLDCKLLLEPVHHNKPVISVDGNIGASKSTVLQGLRDMAVHVVQEPVEEWEGILRKYYTDPARWTATLHMTIMSSFLRLADVRDHQPIVMERSIWSCLNVFHSMLREDGLVDDVEHDCVVRFAERVQRAASCVPDVVIYLRCPPNECARRKAARGRACEDNAGCDDAYLLRLHDRYERVLDVEACARMGIRTIVVDAARTSDEVVADVRKIIADLLYGDE
jgi:deoxyadenosine/deoxycytidine kinase